MQTVFKTLLSITLCFMLSCAFATTQPLVDCHQLAEPNAVLLVHATWCPHCQHYLPTYEEASAHPDMSHYTFYTKENDYFDPVCGVKITVVPITFKNNMQNHKVGLLKLDALLDFLKE